MQDQIYGEPGLRLERMGLPLDRFDPFSIVRYRARKARGRKEVHRVFFFRKTCLQMLGILDVHTN